MKGKRKAVYYWQVREGDVMIYDGLVITQWEGMVLHSEMEDGFKKTCTYPASVRARWKKRHTFLGYL